MTVDVVRTDGRVERHVIPAVPAVAFDTIKRLIDATALDIVHLRDGRVMFVDDNGYDVDVVDKGPDPARGFAFVIERRPVRARKPVNAIATALYLTVCKPGVTHQIVGDVVLARDADFPADTAS